MKHPTDISKRPLTVPLHKELKRGLLDALIRDANLSRSEFKDLLGKVDHVLILTVDPGFYGSMFIPGALEKIGEIKKINNDIDIEVDGGVSDKTIKQICDAGPNLIVSGSYILKSDNPKQSFQELQKVFLS